MKKKFTFLMAALMLLTMVLPWNAVGQTKSVSTLTFTAACGGSGTADDGAKWTVTSDASESVYDNTSGIHYGTNGASVTYVQLATSDITGTISQVVVNCRDARATATVSVTVGGTAFTCSGSATATNTSADYTFTGSASGEIVVKVDRGSSNTKAIYVKSVAVTYSSTPSYTITAESNNTSYGTVSLSGSIITGSPKTGYRYASPAYTVTSGTATVSQNGNDFTVTPSANCTVCINFEAIPTHTATFSVNEDTSLSNDFAEGATITFPSNPAAIQGKVFRGWLATTIDGTTDEEPSCVNTTTTTMGASDVTYYAVFATATPDGDPVETKTQTLQYDTWTYSGSTTDKTEYRLFHTDSYIVSEAFDLSKLSKVIVYGGTFGGTSYNSLTIGDGTNTWKDVTVSGSSQTGSNTYTDGTALSGTKALRVTSKSGTASGSGVRISKVEIYTMETPYTYSAYCTTIVVPVVAPTFSPVAGTYYSGQTVTLNCETTGATIRYTTNGTDPTSSSTEYSSAITLTETTTIKAQAFKDANSSSIAEATYTIKYRVKFYVNGTEDTDSAREIVDGEAIGTLPSATAPNGYTFMGWETSTISGVQPSAPTMVTAETTVEEDMNLRAVFAVGEDHETIAHLSFELTDSYIQSGSGYQTGTSITPVASGSVGLSYTDCLKSSGYIQMKKTSGELHNTSAVDGKITSINIVAGINASNVEVYEGATSSSITTKITGVSNIYTFSGNTQYFKVTNDGTYTQVKITVNYDKETTSTTYSNYCTTVADIADNANIDNGTLTGDVEISSGAYYLDETITVPSGKTLTVNGTGVLVNNTAANLIIEDGGQLIILNSNNDPIALTAKKKIANANSKEPKDHWYTIASPVHTGSNDYVTIGAETTVNLTASSYDMFAYEESSHTWLNQKNNGGAIGFNKMNAGQGYMYRNSGNELSFVGNVNVGAIDMPLSYTSDLDIATLKGFNLIGNPYTHSIAKGSDKAIDNASLSTGCYVLSNSGTWTLITDGNEIKPNQGVLVETSAAVANFQIKDINYVAPVRYNNDNLKFVVENAEYSDAAYAWFDKGIGLTKINHRNDRAPMIYIPQDGHNYAIAIMSDDTKVFGLNFKAATMGQYTLSYKATGEYNYIHVIDRLTGEDVDMLLDDKYTFVATPNDQENRFIVKLGYMPDYSEGDNDIFAYQTGSEILVSGSGELQIFDVTGRQVMTTTINGAESISVPAQGVYIFRLVGNEIKTQKIVVR